MGPIKRQRRSRVQRAVGSEKQPKQPKQPRKRRTLPPGSQPGTYTQAAGLPPQTEDDTTEES
ncbi:hypothetical protein [Streptomyces europaeiscabiei]|uniref:hypothetical protein n=1 Tax=Streptomyces europaeiscabiei TaxID=146819 RepID=UPI0029ABC4A0|nr:hypothetical protein [Streptomyces europaeiscabiei]MDX3666961.1 hypothetical protein [Streptomyces europaeiscabiei]